MNFQELEVPGAYVVECDVVADERGCYVRGWRSDEFATKGLPVCFTQWNQSFSKQCGTLRGLHWQVSPAEEAKLVLCTRGQIYDVVVDVRPDSPQFGKWAGVTVSTANRRMVYVPPGCAHGVLTLDDNCEIFYASTGIYVPSCERGLRFDDECVAIKWPLKIAVVSEKDRNWPPFQNLASSCGKKI